MQILTADTKRITWRPRCIWDIWEAVGLCKAVWWAKSFARLWICNFSWRVDLCMACTCLNHVFISAWRASLLVVPEGSNCLTTAGRTCRYLKLLNNHSIFSAEVMLYKRRATFNFVPSSFRVMSVEWTDHGRQRMMTGGWARRPVPYIYIYAKMWFLERKKNVFYLLPYVLFSTKQMNMPI